MSSLMNISTYTELLRPLCIQQRIKKNNTKPVTRDTNNRKWVNWFLAVAAIMHYYTKSISGDLHTTC